MRLLGTIFCLAATLVMAQEHTPKNLQLLKPEEVRPAMGAFRTALGVNCMFCHVQGDFASDDNPHKIVARKMIKMVRDANATLGEDAKVKVTCYTCHRGKEAPESAPPQQQPQQ